MKALAPIVYIVDDDRAVRSVLKRLLTKAGYQLWDTGDPDAAIRRFTESSPSERPALILTDVIMPAMTGMRMIDQIAKAGTDVRVIYMSGHVQSQISQEGTSGAVVEFLEKPIKTELLLAAVDRVLQGVASPPERTV